jgi:hypothetical protein
MLSSSRAVRFDGGSRRPSWLMISVAVNLVFIGLIFAWVIGMSSRQPVSWQRELIPSLSAADATIARNVAQNLDDNQAATDKLVNAQYANLIAVIKTEPFDRAACAAALDKFTAIRDEHDAQIHKIVVDEMASLSPDGRAKLAAWIENAAGRWHVPWH